MNEIALQQPLASVRLTTTARAFPFLLCLHSYQGSDAKWKQNIEEAIGSTYVHLSGGSCFTVRVGRPDYHSPQEVLENLVAVADKLSQLESIGKWTNIQRMYLKTTSSVSLLIYSADGAEETKKQ